MAIDNLDSTQKLDLLRRISALTAQGDLNWMQVERTEKFDRDDVMSARAGDFTFALSSVDGDGVAPFHLLVFRHERSETITEVAMTALDEGGVETINNLLVVLYETVLREVNNSEEIVRELFAALDQLSSKRQEESNPPSWG